MLNKANAMLYNVREYLSTNTLKYMPYAIFNSHVNYGNVLWGQNINTIKHPTFLH